MKIAVWMSAINNQTIYVSKEKFRKRGPYVENPYADVDEEEEEFTDIEAIIKSGKRKGEFCGCNVNNNSINGFCGKHKNFKPSKVLVNNEWWKNKILKTYY